MNHKLKIGVIFGGKSPEHEVSLQSGKNIIEAIDKDKYDVVAIGISKTGQWFVLDQSNYLLNESDPKQIKLNLQSDNHPVVCIQGGKPGELIDTVSLKPIETLDVVFPILHGPLGEDGAIQGLLKLVDLPYVGCDVLASALAMDKVVAKQLFQTNNIPTPNFMGITQAQQHEIDYQKVTAKLGASVFIKPANMGSSVGVSKATNQEEFDQAVANAFVYDNKIIIEQAIIGRELEVAVLGNDKPIASIPGEIVLNTSDFYSYNAKYINENSATPKIPADIPENISQNLQELAIKTFTTLNCSGLSRVDFFLTPDNQIIVNEVNTLPGFTNISMYPKLWENSGISYIDLIDRLIQLALERFESNKKLKRDF